MPFHTRIDLTELIDEDMRMAVPRCTVAYPLEERDALPSFSMRNVVRMPLESLGRQAVDDLDALRGEGCEYLVVPRTAFGWLEVSTELRAYLEREHVLVTQTENCAIYSLHRRRDFEALGLGKDGLPLPPPELVRITAGGHRQALGDLSVLYSNFWRSGRRGFAALRELLERNGHTLEDRKSVLDFGCGSGRVLRHWNGVDGTRQLYGSDYNEFLIDWCRRNLPFARYQVNGLRPPLDLPDGELDLVYAFSVFSHFDIETQFEWRDELSRVVKPGGLIMFTVPGERWTGLLSPEDRERFFAGEAVVVYPEQNGTNFCSALSPERYIRETLSGDLEVLEFAVDGAPDVRQDAVLLRKPERP
jgi:SAM-dependent methyltransferase